MTNTSINQVYSQFKNKLKLTEQQLAFFAELYSISIRGWIGHRYGLLFNNNFNKIISNTVDRFYVVDMVKRDNGKIEQVFNHTYIDFSSLYRIPVFQNCQLRVKVVDFCQHQQKFNIVDFKTLYID